MDTAGLQNQGSGYQPMSIGDWLITFIITAIPLVGFIMMFVWAFGDGSHPSKKTWAQAALIMTVISIVLVIIILIVFASVLGSLVGGYQQSV
jgi:membrane-associated HD superfamily phosphohydrolase